MIALSTTLPGREDSLATQAEADRFGSTSHRVPRQPAPNVAELSARLYSAYRVDGGSVQLAGCTLEQQPIIHLKVQLRKSRHWPANVESQATSTSAAASGERSVELFVTATGETLDASTIQGLGLNDLACCERPRPWTDEECGQLEAVGRFAVAEYCRAQHAVSVENLIDLEIVWCRWAAGKLRFSIGQEIADLPFADWAALLAPPPFVCPHSGTRSFHLAAVDDGRIVAAQEIAVCDQTGARRLRSELVKCEVTGRLVCAELIQRCPATGQSVLRDQLSICPICRLSVSPTGIHDGRCCACSAMTPVDRSEARVQVLLDRHPRLAAWHNWRLAETSQAYVLEARRLFRRLLVVVDKDTNQISRLAKRNCFQRQWRDASCDKAELSSR